MKRSRCSECGEIGHHSSRACPNIAHTFRLFGVDLKASPPVSNRISLPSTFSSVDSSRTPSHIFLDGISAKHTSAYAPEFDGQIQRSPKRKNGIPWTEEEHRLFLLGLKKLGKGDWRGISSKFVSTRTPVQVAKHAQKYFLRKSNLSRRGRRFSLYDMVEMDEYSMPVVQKIISMTNESSSAREILPKINATGSFSHADQDSKSSRISVPGALCGSRESLSVPSSQNVPDIRSSPLNLELTLAAPSHLLFLFSQKLLECSETNTQSNEDSS